MLENLICSILLLFSFFFLITVHLIVIVATVHVNELLLTSRLLVLILQLVVLWLGRAAARA